MSLSTTPAHVLFSAEDLAILQRRLGPKHPITARVRHALADLTDKTLMRYRTAAMTKARDGELEVDANAIVSKGEDAGAYVHAWLWVSDEDYIAEGGR